MNEELYEQIAIQFDELQLLDFLNIDMEGLVERLKEEIDENEDRFRRSLG